ncbi:hypothetical protein CC1G_11937 [Coprinopsis cinerea okayama7|uniref:t-SNARE coiled-coil homology domain-containing protein n=1 Tax=Coprinopsis cinerea (strain Okayama-7 / 130 / ATCC MYA-4618 / FGSC 9003) TaxID=240176 RepID=A8NFS8_COPC7|nr:hypothetical protein CC1G_11937 [Coprinopsis cinerea okayama7\|eukprot:XP_001833360.2 hypothetical protein CC1G_11937 [Coprinopsis cinerea okayama7\
MSSTVDRLAAVRAQRSRSGREVRIVSPRIPSVSSVSEISGQHQPEPPTSGVVEISRETSPTQPAFFAEVASIQADILRINELINRISEAHNLALSTVLSGEESSGARVDRLAENARDLLENTKNRIKHLQNLPAHYDISLLRSQFLETLQHYQRVEYDADVKSKQNIERQLRFVKPDATAEEVNAFIEEGNHQVFAQALVSSTRYGESRYALREVEQRQTELRRMENTLMDLTRLFNDMGALIEQQEPVIKQVEATAEEVTENTGKA